MFPRDPAHPRHRLRVGAPHQGRSRGVWVPGGSSHDREVREWEYLVRDWGCLAFLAVCHRDDTNCVETLLSLTLRPEVGGNALKHTEYIVTRDRVTDLGWVWMMYGLETSYHPNRGRTLATILSITVTTCSRARNISCVGGNWIGALSVCVNLFVKRYLEALLICENLSSIKSSVLGRKN